MGSMVRDLTDALGNVVEMMKTDAAAPRAVADRVFDAFDKGGAGPLAAWIILSGDVEQLEPVRAAVRALVEAIVGQSTDEAAPDRVRSEEHTSELQSLMRNSHAVFCLKQKIIKSHVDLTYNTHQAIILGLL